jgi:hypothetical protein
MRRFAFLPLVLLAFGALLVAGCSNGDDSSSQDAESSESAGGDSSTGNGSGSGSESDGSDETGGLEEEVQSMLDDAQESVTSLLEEADGAIEGVSECVDVSLAFGKLQAAALARDDGPKQAQDAAEELKGLVPEDLADDIDVISEAIGTMAEEGLTSGSTALSTPEYEAAMNEVTNYVESECGLS